MTTDLAVGPFYVSLSFGNPVLNAQPKKTVSPTIMLIIGAYSMSMTIAPAKSQVIFLFYGQKPIDVKHERIGKRLNDTLVNEATKYSYVIGTTDTITQQS